MCLVNALNMSENCDKKARASFVQEGVANEYV